MSLSECATPSPCCSVRGHGHRESRKWGDLQGPKYLNIWHKKYQSRFTTTQSGNVVIWPMVSLEAGELSSQSLGEFPASSSGLHTASTPLEMDSRAKSIKPVPGVSVYEKHSLSRGSDTCVGTTGALSVAGCPGEGESGPSVQLARTQNTDGKPDGAIVYWHPTEITWWAIAQHPALQHRDWELPGDCFLLMAQPRDHYLKVSLNRGKVDAPACPL